MVVVGYTGWLTAAGEDEDDVREFPGSGCTNRSCSTRDSLAQTCDAQLNTFACFGRDDCIEF
jgi:hypothetical protein